MNRSGKNLPFMATFKWQILTHPSLVTDKFSIGENNR